MPEKIVNIAHADKVLIEAPKPVLSETEERLNRLIESIPGIIESTMAMLAQRTAPDLFNNTVLFADNDLSMPMTPVSLKSKQENSYNVGDVIMDHWQIDRCIGKGSFSTVYEAHHTDHGSLYKSAIKVIPSALRYHTMTDNDDRSHTTLNGAYMIHQELDNMVELRGTGYIVDYEDHEIERYNNGTWDILIRMELLQSLSDVLRLKTLSIAEVVRLGIDICKALEFCNRSNVIHRDVKPSNIYLTKWGGYKLGDFSASIKTGYHQELDQIGTLKYMAPEIYSGKPFTSSIDIYSLGLVLYQLMNENRMPFESKRASAGDRESALLKRLSGAPLPPIPGVDKALQSVILKACSFDTRERFSSATEMLNELLKLHLASDSTKNLMMSRSKDW